MLNWWRYTKRNYFQGKPHYTELAYRQSNDIVYTVGMDTTIQFRIDKATKVSAQKVFGELGLDMSSALKLFLRTVSRTKSIPFEIRTANGFTPAQEARMIKEAEWAEKHGKRYKSAEELTKNLLS